MAAAAAKPDAKFVVRGKVRDIKTRWHFLLFPKRYALISMDPADIRRIERELVRRFPLHPSLGSRGPAVPFSQLDDPTKYSVGQRVLMTFVVANMPDEYFLGRPDLALTSIKPI